MLGDTSARVDIPEMFDCLLELPDEECGVYAGQVDSGVTSGVKTCQLCGYAYFMSREETPDDGTPTFSEADDTDDDEDNAGGEVGSVGEDTNEIATFRTPLERIKFAFWDALTELTNNLDASEDPVCVEVATHIRRNRDGITQIYMKLQEDKYFGSGVTLLTRAIVMTIIHRLQTSSTTTPNSVLKELGYDVNKVRVLVSRTIRELSGQGENEVVQYMRVYAKSLDIDSTILADAISLFMDADAPYNPRSPQARAIVWLLLTVEVITGKKFNASEASRVSGVNRKTISDVKKAYADYFATVMPDA